MNEESNHNVTPDPSQIQPDVAALIRRIQEHLVILERKIDSLIMKSQERSAFKEKHFSKPFQKPFQKSFAKPFRSFSPSPYQGKREQDADPRKSRFAKGPQFKSQHQSDENRGFDKKKKPFFQKKKERR